MNAVIARVPTSFRIYTTIFALILGVSAAWLLAAEFLRASVPFFPTGQIEIQYASAQRDKAAVAARVGWIRGDLWTDYALSADSRQLSDNATSTTNEDAERVSERALTHAPYEARLWLMLSAINAKSGWKERKTLSQLKMSYYTAPNDTRLMPLRIATAMQSQAIGDEELQGLVEHELRTIVARRPELKPVLAKVYIGASSAGRHFMEEKLALLDPKFLIELQSKSP